MLPTIEAVIAHALVGAYVGLVVFGVLAAVDFVYGELQTNNTVSVTSTSQTITVGTSAAPATDVVVVNDSTSANEMYFRLFSCSETTAAATTSSVRLEKGESRSYRHPQTQPGYGYCAVSLVCANAETATARLEWQ